jgi:hypothetical protein
MAALPLGQSLPLLEGLVGLPSILLITPSSVTWIKMPQECRHILQLDGTQRPLLSELAVGCCFLLDIAIVRPRYMTGYLQAIFL